MQEFASEEEFQAYMIERNAQRESMLENIAKAYTVTTLPSDKLGQLWKVTKLGEVEIMREYVPDPNPYGTADFPFIYEAGSLLLPNHYYTHDGVRYVFVGVTQRTAIDWATDSADMEQF